MVPHFAVPLEDRTPPPLKDMASILAASRTTNGGRGFRDNLVDQKDRGVAKVENFAGVEVNGESGRWLGAAWYDPGLRLVYFRVENGEGTPGTK